MSRAVFVASLLWASAAAALPPSPTDLDWLRNEAGDGALAYQSDGKIYLTELATGATVLVGDGVGAELSPDSSKLAWRDGSTIKGRMRKGDSTVHEIATGVMTTGGAHWYDDDELLVLKGGKWYRASLTGEQVEVTALTALGTGGDEGDVKQGGDGVWSFVSGGSWETSDGDSGGTGGTCSSSLSPDGRSVTGLMAEHKVCKLTRIRSGGVSGQLDWVYDFSGSKGFDNHRWSSNDARFVTVQDEKYNFMFVMKVGGTYGTRIGEQGTGEMYGDFSVGNGDGDPWPGTGGQPMLDLDSTGLTFAAVVGGSAPADKTVVVTNGGEGTLDAVSTSTTYRDGSAWLTVSRTGTGNNQTLHNAIDIASLGVGTYDATVEVSSSTAPSSRTYDVSLVIGDGVTNQAPVADAGFDQTTEVGTTLHLYGEVSDDGLPSATLDVLWSKLDGPDEVLFGDATSVTTPVDFAASGTYTLRLSADDGALQAADEVTVTVAERPAISILAPSGGEQLVPGTTFVIEWETVNLDDVAIDYSTDGGASWTNIIGSVDIHSEHWGAYPWSVPADASAACLIQVVGYFGEAPTLSGGTFTIVGDGNPVSQSATIVGQMACSAADRAGSTWLVVGLFLLLRRRRD